MENRYSEILREYTFQPFHFNWQVPFPSLVEGKKSRVIELLRNNLSFIVILQCILSKPVTSTDGIYFLVFSKEILETLIIFRESRKFKFFQVLENKAGISIKIST